MLKLSIRQYAKEILIRKKIDLKNQEVKKQEVENVIELESDESCDKTENQPKEAVKKTNGENKKEIVKPATDTKILLQNFVKCEGFTKSDIALEQYFNDNHEGVEKVWKRRDEVFLKFKDQDVMKTFLSLAYVKFKGKKLESRPLVTNTAESEREKYVKYLLGESLD